MTTKHNANSRSIIARSRVWMAGGHSRTGNFLRSFRFGVLFAFSVLAFVFYIPAIYTLNASIPPLEEVTRSEGVLSFSTKHPRSGYRTILRENAGTVHKFSCKQFATDSSSCIAREFEGMRAVVWWHPLSVHPWETNEHPVQIEVGGKLVLSYERTQERLTANKKSIPITLGIATTLMLVGLFGLYQIKRRMNRAISAG